MELVSQYPGLVAIGVILILVILFLVFRPRQSVRLSTTDQPVRAHMLQAEAGHGEVPVPIINSGAPKQPTASSGPADDLLQLKGVGPKLADLLHQQGITRFEQIAGLSAAQIEALDTNMGAFRGRLVRDKVVEQAHYLASGDIDGFEEKFGKL